jgi:hypothetical protein
VASRRILFYRSPISLGNKKEQVKRLHLENNRLLRNYQPKYCSNIENGMGGGLLDNCKRTEKGYYFIFIIHPSDLDLIILRHCEAEKSSNGSARPVSMLGVKRIEHV